MIRSYKGLKTGEKEVIKEEQNGTCGICFSDNVPLVIDHDHETGFVRKALCVKCNNGLGQFDDDYDTLLRAACYVLVHKAGLSDLRIGYRLMFDDMQKRLETHMRQVRRKAKEQICQQKRELSSNPVNAEETTRIVEHVGPEMSMPRDLGH